MSKTKSIFETLDGIPSLPYITAGLRSSTSNKRTTYIAETLVNSDTAAWFASLPSTVRRKHFTKEEQILLANERQHIILDAADELLQKQRPPTDSDLLWLPRPEAVDTPQQSPRPSFDSSEDEENMNSHQYMESLSWLNNSEELDLRLDDYHTAIAETAQRQQAPVVPLKHSYRRNMSLSTVSLRRTSISSPTISASRVPSLYFNRLQTPTTPQRPNFHHAATSSVSTVDPRAAHYQDPAARKKLRVYLASPSKFDEALEFGFPSVSGAQVRLPERPKTSPRAPPSDISRFLQSDDVPSLIGDDDSSHSENDGQSDPRTPNETDFRSVQSKKSSVDRVSMKPQVARSEQYAQSATLDREMTIHMTLTRPDLRSPTETRPSSRHINSQPLEQAPLTPMESGPSVWDGLPAPQESKVKRLWKKMKGF